MICSTNSYQRNVINVIRNATVIFFAMTHLIKIIRNYSKLVKYQEISSTQMQIQYFFYYRLQKRVLDY